MSAISSYMATSFSGGRSRSTRREPPTMGKQLVIFITCGCESKEQKIIYKELHRKLEPHYKPGGELMCSGGSGRINSFFSTRDTRKSCCNEYELLFSDDERDKCEDMIYVIIYFC
jgi:hypothetical protein